MKCFVLILSLLLSLFSGGKPDNVSEVSSAESRYSVSERSSSENAVDHTINRDICITAAQGYSFTGNNSTNSVSVRTTNTGLGILVGVCGLLMLIFYKAAYKREGDDTVLRKSALDISHSCRDSLKEFLDGKEVEPEVNASVNGGVIRLEVYHNATASVAYAQLFDFSNYTYVPATEIVELRGKRAESLIRKIA